MSRPAAVFAVELGILDQFFDPAEVFPDDDPAQMIFFVLFWRYVAKLAMRTHGNLLFDFE